MSLCAYRAQGHDEAYPVLFIVHEYFFQGDQGACLVRLCLVHFSVSHALRQLNEAKVHPLAGSDCDTPKGPLAKFLQDFVLIDGGAAMKPGISVILGVRGQTSHRIRTVEL